MQTVLPLSKVSAKSHYRILNLNGESDSVIRLQELGFMPGIFVEFVGKMTFGGPLVFRLHGTKIALRADDAESILVSPN